jgi:hypothetical protein
MLDKDSSIALIAHDAGSANLLIHFLQASMIKPNKVYVSGPARKIWQNSVLANSLSNSIEEAISDCSVVITGTGWQTDIEHKARTLSKNKKLHTIACLDHWVNYEERFFFNGELVLPDEIWVFDKYAQILANKIFPETKTVLQTNFYLEHMVKLAKMEKEPDIPELLYLSEPIRDDWGKENIGELTALNFFFQNIEKLALPDDYNFVFRCHPSEDENKYIDALDKKNICYSFDNNNAVSKSLGRAKWVVGCQTYAMVIACALNRHVFSCLPPTAPKLVLPNKEIYELRNLK